MRVAIVGGGISGLSLAERLVSLGAEPLILEAGDRPGGKIASKEKDGFLLETGPNGFLDKEPETLHLAARSGMGGSLRQAESLANRRWLFLRGRMREVPTRPQAFLRSDILPPWAKLRIALEPLSRRSRAPDESIADFGRRHLGARATRDLLSAMVLGIFAGDVEELSLPACFPKMAALEREHRSLILAMKRKGKGGAPQGVLTSCEGGMGNLVDGVAKKLGSSLQTGASVSRILQVRGGIRLTVDGKGGQTELDADAVAITAPAFEAARLLAPLDPAASDLAAEVPYAPMAVVHLAWPKEKIAHPLDGFGFLIPPGEGRGILGALFISSIFPWRAPRGQALFTVMVGGAVAPHLVNSGEEALVELARSELSAIVGASGSPSLAEVVRWERAIPQYLVGHVARTREIDARMEKVESVFLGGNAWNGVGINDCIAAAGPLAERIVRSGSERGRQG